MSDERLRQLERAARAGDPEAAARLERERERTTVVYRILVGVCSNDDEEHSDTVWHVLQNLATPSERPMWSRACTPKVMRKITRDPVEVRFDRVPEPEDGTAGAEYVHRYHQPVRLAEQDLPFGRLCTRCGRDYPLQQAMAIRLSQRAALGLVDVAGAQRDRRAP
jgi:hypothetical protein